MERVSACEAYLMMEDSVPLREYPDVEHFVLSMEALQRLPRLDYGLVRTTSEDFYLHANLAPPRVRESDDGSESRG